MQLQITFFFNYFLQFVPVIISCFAGNRRAQRQTTNQRQKSWRTRCQSFVGHTHSGHPRPGVTHLLPWASGAETTVEYKDDNNKKNAHPSFANRSSEKEKQNVIVWRQTSVKIGGTFQKRGGRSPLVSRLSAPQVSWPKFTTLLCYFGIFGKQLWVLGKRVHVIGGVALVREGGDCASEATFKCCSFNIENSTFKWTKLKSKFGRDLAPRQMTNQICMAQSWSTACRRARTVEKTTLQTPNWQFEIILKLPCEAHSRTEYLHHQQKTIQRQPWQSQGLSWAPLDAVCVYLMVIWELIGPDFLSGEQEVCFSWSWCQTGRFSYVHLHTGVEGRW